MSDSERIAFFISKLGGGGAERTIANLSKGFAELGCSVDLLVIQKEGTYLETVPDVVNIIEFNADRALWTIPELTQYLNNVKPDVLFSTMEFLNVTSLIASRLSGTEVKSVIREATIPSAKEPSGLKQGAQYRLANRLYPTADRIIALSNDVRQDMSMYYGLNMDDIDVIYNPINIPEIRSLSTAKPSLDIPNSKSDLIVSAGRFVEKNDIPTTIKAFNILLENYDAELVLLGDGKKREKIEELIARLGIEEHITLPGFVDNPYAYFSAADVTVSSSKWEGFGHVLVESMACGTPVVATDCPGAPSEILQNGEWGRLSSVGKPKELAKQISLTFSDPTSGEDLKKRADDFHYQKISSIYHEVIFGSYHRTPHTL